MKRLRAAGAAMLLALGAACSGDGSGQCPNDLPAGCVDPAPSYQVTIAPLIQRRCLLCHAPGGVEANRPLDSYSAVYANRSAMLTQVYSCAMPPSEAMPLDSAERQQLLQWLVCKAPSN